jgi:transposase-like protein
MKKKPLTEQQIKKEHLLSKKLGTSTQTFRCRVCKRHFTKLNAEKKEDLCVWCAG